MVGQANFSHKELQNKSCNMIQDMLFTQKNINWNDLPVYQKRGSCCIKEAYTDNERGESIRTRWVIDKDIPMFKEDDDEGFEESTVIPSNASSGNSLQDRLNALRNRVNQ